MLPGSLTVTGVGKFEIKGETSPGQPFSISHSDGDSRVITYSGPSYDLRLAGDRIAGKTPDDSSYSRFRSVTETADGLLSFHSQSQNLHEPVLNLRLLLGPPPSREWPPIFQKAAGLVTDCISALAKLPGTMAAFKLSIPALPKPDDLLSFGLEASAPEALSDQQLARVSQTFGQPVSEGVSELARFGLEQPHLKERIHSLLESRTEEAPEGDKARLQSRLEAPGDHLGLFAVLAEVGTREMGRPDLGRGGW